MPPTDGSAGAPGTGVQPAAAAVFALGADIVVSAGGEDDGGAEKRIRPN